MENIQQDYLSKIYNKILSVSEVNDYIKNLLERDDILYNLKIEGELTGFKLHSSGHAYFSIKDRNSLIKVVFFKNNQKSDIRSFQDGDKVILTGSIGVYSQRGEYQIYAKKLEKSGLGSLAVKFEELKKKLLQKGYFDKERKKPIPHIINKIGIVSGKDAAGFKDMLKILKKEKFDIILRNSKVQGKDASFDISQGIKELNDYKDLDIIIIGRGGGSIEDLWCFNEEIVADSVYNSEIPIISAVGHEVDMLISDMVADMRAETPTAAAEFIVNRKKQLRVETANVFRTLRNNILNLLKNNREKFNIYSEQRFINVFSKYNERQIVNFNILKKNFEKSPQRIIEIKKNKFKELIHRFIRKESIVNDARVKIDRLNDELVNSMNKLINKKKEKINFEKMRLNITNPLNIMKKGYCVIKDENTGKLIRSISSVDKKSKLDIMLSDGRIKADVIDIKK